MDRENRQEETLSLIKKFVMVAGWSVLLLTAAVACNNVNENGVDPNTEPEVLKVPVSSDGQSMGGSNAVLVTAPSVPQMSATRNTPNDSGSLVQVNGPQSGIWVTGQGKLSLEPDLALVNIGVEAIADTVAEARDEAADAINAILTAVKAQGLTEKDVQTRSFNIWPRYEFPEVIDDGMKVRKQVLVGYTVNNTTIVKIRDMNKIGVIIDDIAAAGMDTTRIDGINFTVEDSSPYMAELREAAVTDALGKAGHFAQLTGVSVGPLTFISEIGSGTPEMRDFQESGFARMAASPAPTTAISSGELELSLNIQAVFEIK